MSVTPATESEKTPDELVADFRAASVRLGNASLERHRAALDRAMAIAGLQAAGWSLQQIAGAVGLSKNAIAKAAKVGPRDKRISETVDGTWVVFCPHGVGEVEAREFSTEVEASQYLAAHDRAIHGTS